LGYNSPAGANVANLRVSIVVKVKNATGKWTYVSAGVTPEQKLTIKQRAKPGRYSLTWREGNRQRFEAAGKDLGEAQAKAQVKLLQLQARAQGVDWHIGNAADPDRLTLRDAIDAYLEEIELTRRATSHQLFKYDLNEFAVWAKHVVFIDQMTRMDLLKFKDWAQKSGRSERTAGNKMARVNQFHRAVMKIDPGKGLTTVKDSKSVEKEVEIYSAAELETFFAACSPEQSLLYTTLLQTGLRMRELMYLYWSDVDLVKNVLHVREKPEFDFRTKTWEERNVTLPSRLAALLKEAKKTATHRLVFPTKSGKPNDKWLQALKRIAKRARLNCGVCETCVERGECQRWYLHKFRSTYATTLLRKGVDVASVRTQLGHKDLESIERYAKAIEAESKGMQEKINSAWD
jgi:integrase/recombinase XerD